MLNYAAFIDLPNIYSGLIRSNLAEPKILRDYFLYWLDLDLLVSKFTNYPLNTWVFYSGDRIGPSSARITDEHLKKYIDRINSLVGVTARNVNIPGEQREPLFAKCEHCGQEITAQSKSEKGVDSALTVHLFDTMDAWDTAYLLSGDADFVPIVESLRRRGKVVIGAGFPGAAPALVRECYTYISLLDTFITEDIVVYQLLNPNGIVARWLNNVEPDPATEPDQLKIVLRWPASDGFDNSSLDLAIFGSCNVDNLRIELVNTIGSSRFSYQEYRKEDGNHFYFPTSSTQLQVVQRKVEKIPNFIQGSHDIRWSSSSSSWMIKYQYNSNSKKYEIVT